MNDQSQPAGSSKGLRSRGLLVGLVAVAVLVPAGIVAALTASSDDGAADRPFRAEPEPPTPKKVERGVSYPVARITERRTLYRRPGGKARVRIAGRTEFKTPRVLSVVRRRGDWLAVLASELKNGELGWIRRENVGSLSAVTWSLHAELSGQALVVRRAGKRVRRLRVGVGRAEHKTPTGRFAVTDRLRVTDPNSPYGCCVLALTGHQTRVPPGWPGGDRLAVHATGNLGDLGRAVSLGCLRADPRDARWLIRHVPLGTPVFIRG